MTTSYKQFFASIKENGLAKANRFEIEIGIPELLLDKAKSSETQDVPEWVRIAKIIGRVMLGTQTITRGLQLMCESTSIPGKSIATTENRHNGVTYKLPYSIIYNTQEFTFLSSSDMLEKSAIDDWLSIIVDADTYNVEYYDNYVAPITIHQLDANNNRVYSVLLEDAYPILCNASPLSNTDRMGVHRISVEFAYKRWRKLEDTPSTRNQSFISTAISQIPAIANNPLARKGLDILKESGLDLTGEAENIYNQIDTVISDVAGVSAARAIGILDRIKVDTQNNQKISTNDKAGLIGAISNAIAKLGS